MKVGVKMKFKTTPNKTPKQWGLKNIECQSVMFNTMAQSHKVKGRINENKQL
jgi:hypothetical protein